MARVFGIVLRTFDFMAILTGPHTTEVTLPLGAEKSAAICLCVGARSYESGALGCGGRSFGIGGGAYTNAIIDTLFFGGNRASLCFKISDPGSESCFFIAENILASDEFGDALADGEKRFFFLEHNRLAMFFPILCDEFLSEVFDKEFTRKLFVTFHTVGDLIGWIKYDGGVALTTGFETARLAGDWDMGRAIVFLATNEAFSFWEGWRGWRGWRGRSVRFHRSGDGGDGDDDGSDDGIGVHN